MKMKHTSVFRRSALVSAVSLGLGLVAAGSAQAGAYGYSLNDISVLTVTPTSSSAFVITSYLASSTADATLNGSGVTHTDTTTAGCVFGTCNRPDAPVANAPGSAPIQGNNVFTAIYPNRATDYSVGDAQIASQAASGDANTHAITEAETNLVTSGNNTNANGLNTSATGFNVVFDVVTPLQLTFDFNANPFLRAILDPNTLGGSTVDLDTSFTIANAAGQTIFSWTPDGSLGSGISGGSESADDANLNVEISQLAPGMTVYDPVNGVGSFNCGGIPCDFTAQTNVIPIGTGYRLTLTMHSGSVINAAAVPEPATLALLGVGLAGIGMARRRKVA